jgi:hypothetical protein
MSQSLPVLFIPFSRVEIASRVFERIREAQPSRLYLAMDAPRAGHPDEIAANDRLRRKLPARIDWDCELVTLFSEENKGPNVFIEEALTWFFDHEEWGLVLEEDCLPVLEYFEFCEQVLKKYANDDRVQMIVGSNVVPALFRHWKPSDSYVFSKYPRVWGLASWRRAWKSADRSFDRLEGLLASGYLDQLFSKRIAGRLKSIYARLKSRECRQWDGMLVYSVFEKQGLVIYPAVNMVSNIGSSGGYNTHSYDPMLNIPAESSGAPIVHPEALTPNPDFENYMHRYIYPRTYWRTVLLLFKRNGAGAFPKLFQAVYSVVRARLKG